MHILQQFCLSYHNTENPFNKWNTVIGLKTRCRCLGMDTYYIFVLLYSAIWISKRCRCFKKCKKQENAAVSVSGLINDLSPKEKTRSQCSVIVVKKYRVICLFLASFFFDFLLRKFSRRLLCYYIIMFSLWKYQVQKEKERERDFCVCIMMEASQSREEEPLAPDVSSPIYACWKQ